MSIPALLACGWCVLANCIGMFPSKHKHWPAFYALITIGVPLLAWVYWADGWIFGLIFTIAAMSIFRWPVVYALRWFRTQTFGRAETKG